MLDANEQSKDTAEGIPVTKDEATPVATITSISEPSRENGVSSASSVAQENGGKIEKAPTMENNFETEPTPAQAAANGNSNRDGNGVASSANGRAADEVNGDKPEKKQGDGDDKEGGDEGEDMDIEPPQKLDVMVDYTDEFGRVRTMLQRCISISSF